MSVKLKYPDVCGYKLVRQIGGGGFSTVFRAVNFNDECVAACKMVTFTPQTTERERKMLDKEMRVHANLKHRNILRFIKAIIVEPDGLSPFYPGLYMLLELAAGGDLFDKIVPEVGLSDETSHYYFTQLVSGLSYIHSEGVCHRDLKPENMLLDSAGTLKISDFGLSAVYKIKETGKTRKLSERCGSLPYVAPELSGEEPYEAQPIDVWGCGVILFALMTGNTPWDEPTKRSHEFQRYCSGHCFDSEPWSCLGESLLSLLTGMLAVDPEQRLTLPEVFEHPWVMRPSQLAGRGMTALAQELTRQLRDAGDLDIATPDINTATARDVDADGDTYMRSPPHATTPFTQTLLLFSQTQGGRRYTPQLTRFYNGISPALLIPLIQEALVDLGVKFKNATEVSAAAYGGASGEKMLRMRIGGVDKRRVMYKGWVEIEPFQWGGKDGSFCVMQRDQGNPISWRQLWRAVIMSPTVEPHVLRKRQA